MFLRNTTTHEMAYGRDVLRRWPQWQRKSTLVFLVMLVVMVSFVVLVLGWCRLPREWGCLYVIDKRQRMRRGDGDAERAGRARHHDGARVPRGGMVHLLSQDESGECSRTIEMPG